MPQDDTRILDAFVRDAHIETGIPLVDAQHQQLVKAVNSPVVAIDRTSAHLKTG